MSDLTTAQKLIDELYASGYQDARKERDYDPRGCKEWQAVVDLIEQLEAQLKKKDIELQLLERDLQLERELHHATESGITELAATVERLRKAIEYCTTYLAENKLNSIGYGSKAHTELTDALESTPHQSLAEHDAEVARVAYLACAEEYGLAYAHASKEGIERSANQYAQRIKAGDL